MFAHKRATRRVAPTRPWITSKRATWHQCIGGAVGAPSLGREDGTQEVFARAPPRPGPKEMG